MNIEVLANIEISDIVEKVNKLKWDQRLLVLFSFLNLIEFATEAEMETMASEEKKKIYYWLKRKIEWINISKDQITNRSTLNSLDNE